MAFTDAELQALDGDTQRLGFFFRLATTPMIRLWLGAGGIIIDGELFQGFGGLTTMPSFQQLLNGAAERVDITLSGVTPDLLALASTEAASVQFKACDFGFAILDQNWQALGGVHWTRRGYADVLKLVVTPASSPGEQTAQTIVLSVGGLMTGRRRRGLSFWTDQDQQRRSPGDLFCSRTVFYSQLIQKAWPRFP